MAGEFENLDQVGLRRSGTKQTFKRGRKEQTRENNKKMANISKRFFFTAVDDMQNSVSTFDQQYHPRTLIQNLKYCDDTSALAYTF